MVMGEARGAGNRLLRTINCLAYGRTVTTVAHSTESRKPE